MWTALLLGALLQQTPAVSTWVTVHAAESLLLNRIVPSEHLLNLRVWDRTTNTFRKAEPAELAPRTGFTVIHFWADYCAPCLDELPSLLSLTQHFGKKYKQRVRVMFVTETLGADEMKRFLDRNPRAFPPDVTLYQDTAGAFFGYLRESLPASRGPQLPSTLLLDAKGTIRQAIVGSALERKAELYNHIERLLEHPE